MVKERTLTSLYGHDAMEVLVEEIGKHPAIYSLKISPNAAVSSLTGDSLVAWNEMIGALKIRLSAQVQSEPCWRSWRSLRRKYLTGLNSPNAIKNKWTGRIVFLHEFGGKSGTNRRYSSPEPRKNSKKAAKEKGARSSSTNSRYRAQCGNLDKCVRLLIAKCSTFAVLHDVQVDELKCDLEQLPQDKRCALRELMLVIHKTYPNATALAAWQTWAKLAYDYSVDKAPKKWVKPLFFLEKLKKSKMEPKRPRRALKRRRTEDALKENVAPPSSNDEDNFVALATVKEEVTQLTMRGYPSLTASSRGHHISELDHPASSSQHRPHVFRHANIEEIANSSEHEHFRALLRKVFKKIEETPMQQRRRTAIQIAKEEALRICEGYHEEDVYVDVTN